MTLPTLTIGIPAHNEAQNIGLLVADLKKQKISSFQLDQVFIYSDGSTDNTLAVVAGVDWDKIKLANGSPRKGLACGLNEIISNTSSDILVILNADVRIPDELAMEKLAMPVIRNESDLVSGGLKEAPRCNFFDRIIFTGMQFKNDVFKDYMGGNNFYNCHGPIRAFSKRLYSGMSFVSGMGDDLYSYIYCIGNGYKFAYLNDVEAVYQLPRNFKDHLKQSVRFFRAKDALVKDIDELKIAAHLKVPLGRYIRIGFKNFFKHPVLIPCYVAVTVLSFVVFILSQNGKVKNDLWSVVQSSKAIK
jgi:glycosyltransferase involved in cell wall biosynthesis